MHHDQCYSGLHTRELLAHMVNIVLAEFLTRLLVTLWNGGDNNRVVYTDQLSMDIANIPDFVETR